MPKIPKKEEDTSKYVKIEQNEQTKKKMNYNNQIQHQNEKQPPKQEHIADPQNKGEQQKTNPSKNHPEQKLQSSPISKSKSEPQKDLTQKPKQFYMNLKEFQQNKMNEVQKWDYEANNNLLTLRITGFQYNYEIQNVQKDINSKFKKVQQYVPGSFDVLFQKQKGNDALQFIKKLKTFAENAEKQKNNGPKMMIKIISNEKPEIKYHLDLQFQKQPQKNKPKKNLPDKELLRLTIMGNNQE